MGAQLFDATVVKMWVVSEEVAFGIIPDHGKWGAEDEFVVEGQRIQIWPDKKIDLAIDQYVLFQPLRIELDHLPKSGWMCNDQSVEVF